MCLCDGASLTCFINFCTVICLVDIGYRVGFSRMPEWPPPLELLHTFHHRWKYYHRKYLPTASSRSTFCAVSVLFCSRSRCLPLFTLTVPFVFVMFLMCLCCFSLTSYGLDALYLFLFLYCFLFSLTYLIPVICITRDTPCTPLSPAFGYTGSTCFHTS